MKKKVNKKTKSALKASEEKWGKKNIDAGYTVVPNALLIHQASLGLTTMDLVIILQIAQYWWDAKNHPFPSKQTLANSIGCTTRTIQKRISDMHKNGFLERVERREGKGSKTNIYQLTPLTEILEPYSVDIKKERLRRKKEDIARPKKRGLSVKKGKKEGAK